MNRLLVWVSLASAFLAVCAVWAGHVDKATFLMANAAFARASAWEDRK